eukprot:gene10367-2501_t
MGSSTSVLGKCSVGEREQHCRYPHHPHHRLHQQHQYLSEGENNFTKLDFSCDTRCDNHEYVMAIPASALLDPRSPTAAFPRTPLHQVTKKRNSRDAVGNTDDSINAMKESTPVCQANLSKSQPHQPKLFTEEEHEERKDTSLMKSDAQKVCVPLLPKRAKTFETQQHRTDSPKRLVKVFGNRTNTCLNDIRNTLSFIE